MDQNQEQDRDPEANMPRRQRSSLPSILFLTLILFMLTNNRTDDVSARTHYAEALEGMRREMGEYSKWLNGTGGNFTLTPMNEAEMPLVSSLLTFGSELDPTQGSYYTNLTGFWRGDVQFHNLTSSSNATDQDNSTLAPPPWKPVADRLISSSNFTSNITTLSERLGSWNWNASNRAAISVGDKLVWSKSGSSAAANVSEDIAVIHGKIDLTNPLTSDELRIDFDGVHFISNGSIYALAASGGSRNHPDLRHVPALVPSHRMNETARVIEVEEYARIAKNKEKLDAGTLDLNEDDDDGPKTDCAFEFFAQLDPSSITKSQMEELEAEIDKPTGISTVARPPLVLDAVLVSRDCGMLFELKDIRGLKSQSLYRKITTYAGLSAIVNAILLLLLTRQMSRSHSAVGLARVSRYPFLAQSLIDAVSFVGHLTLAILAEGRPSLAVLAPAGLSCILFVREAQFSVLIGQIQAPEDAEIPPSPRPPTPQPQPQPVALSAPAPVSAVPTTEDSANEADSEQAPLTGAQTAPPVTAAPAPTPTQTTPTTTPTTTVTPAGPQRPSFLRFLFHHIRSDPAARLWTIMSFFLIVVFRLVVILSLPLLFVSCLYAFMWVPQIHRAVRRGRTSGMSAEYLLGVTVCRLFYLLYFMGCPKNILDVEPRRWVWLVVFLMFLQISVLLLQDLFGPTFFLPRKFVKTTGYDYHPSLSLPDPEAPEQTLGDCAICMDAIEVDRALRQRHADDEKRGLGLGRAGAGALWAQAGVRKSYSLAPCHHLFHTACLERWLAIKNICPQCRRPLPPL